jgi:UDP-glucose 4-epimerase
MAVSLVTGGAGFIGSHLVEALVSRGDSVRVLDNFSTGNPANLHAVRDSIEMIVGDVADEGVVRAALRNVEVVFHLAARVPADSGDDQLEVHHTATTGTLHVLRAAVEAGVRRVVFGGTASVYRAEEAAPRSEGAPTRAESLYAIGKLAAEDYCVVFGHCYGLETVRLRYFNVFGPRQPVDGPNTRALARLLTALCRGRNAALPGDGHVTRDFTHVRDAVQASLLAADTPRVVGKLYNVGTGQPTTLAQLARILSKLLGTKTPTLQDPGPAEEPRYLWADVTRAQTELGYCPCTDLPRDLATCLDGEDGMAPEPVVPLGLPTAGLRLDEGVPVGRSPFNQPHWEERTRFEKI